MGEISRTRRHPERFCRGPKGRALSEVEGEGPVVRFAATTTLVSAALCALVVTFNCVVYGQAQKPANDFLFPVTKGTYWIYAGDKKWTNEANQVQATRLRWRVEVLDYFDHGAIAVLLLKGAPWAPSVVENAGAEHLVMRFKDTYYFLDQGRASFDELRTIVPLEAAKKLQLVHAGARFLTPLHAGEGVCDSGMEPDACKTLCYKEGRYCWFVADSQLVRLKVKGAPAQAVPEYSLQYRTNPDHTLLKIVPGIGVTFAEYVHHGTVDEHHARLVEFQPAGSSQAIEPANQY